MARGLKQEKDSRFPAFVICPKCSFKEVNKHFDPEMSVCGNCSFIGITYTPVHYECTAKIPMKQVGRPPVDSTDKPKDQPCGSRDIVWAKDFPTKCNKCGATGKENFTLITDGPAMRWWIKEKKFIKNEDYEELARMKKI